MTNMLNKFNESVLATFSNTKPIQQIKTHLGEFIAPYRKIVKRVWKWIYTYSQLSPIDDYEIHITNVDYFTNIDRYTYVTDKNFYGVIETTDGEHIPFVVEKWANRFQPYSRVETVYVEWSNGIKIGSFTRNFSITVKKIGSDFVGEIKRLSDPHNEEGAAFSKASMWMFGNIMAECYKITEDIHYFRPIKNL